VPIVDRSNRLFFQLGTERGTSIETMFGYKVLRLHSDGPKIEDKALTLRVRSLAQPSALTDTTQVVLIILGVSIGCLMLSLTVVVNRWLNTKRQLDSKYEAQLELLSSPLDSSQGAILDLEDLTIGEIIGHGNSGHVFRGSYSDCDVAIKKIMVSASMARQIETEVKKEASVLARLRHPYILRYFGIATSESAFFLVTELCPNSMETILFDHKHYKIDAAMKHKFVLQLSQGLKYLHSVLIIHRDLKPPNILLDRNMDVKIADFGLSRRRDGDHSSGPMTMNIGTPAYLAPEVIAEEDEGDYNEAVDVYSFGIMVWALHSRTRPYEGVVNVFALIARIAGGARPKWDASVPPQVRDFVERCWNADPALRPSFAKVVEELENNYTGHKGGLFHAPLFGKLKQTSSALWKSDQLSRGSTARGSTASSTPSPPQGVSVDYSTSSRRSYSSRSPSPIDPEQTANWNASSGGGLQDSTELLEFGPHHVSPSQSQQSQTRDHHGRASAPTNLHLHSGASASVVNTVTATVPAPNKITKKSSWVRQPSVLRAFTNSAGRMLAPSKNNCSTNSLIESVDSSDSSSTSDMLNGYSASAAAGGLVHRSREPVSQNSALNNRNSAFAVPKLDSSSSHVGTASSHNTPQEALTTALVITTAGRLDSVGEEGDGSPSPPIHARPSRSNNDPDHISLVDLYGSANPTSYVGVDNPTKKSSFANPLSKHV